MFAARGAGGSRHNIDMVRLVFLRLLLAGIGVAADFPCKTPAEIQRLTIPEIRSRLDAGQTDFFLYKRLLDLTPTRPKPGTLAAEFEQRLNEHPADAGFLYLYERALVGKNTPEAMRSLQRAEAAAPALPWTYLAFAEIYASRNFSDKEKLLSNLRMYRKLCPANVDALRYLDNVTGRVESAAWARDLRPILEKSSGPADGLYWRRLWAAEFRGAEQPEYEAIRARVAADVKRLEGFPETRDLLGALWDGYGLTGNTEAKDRVDWQLNPDQGVLSIYDDWLRKAGLRGANLTEDQEKAAYLEYAKVSREWVEKWPKSLEAWTIRLCAMTAGDFTKEELEHVGEQCLMLDAANPIGWSYNGRKRLVAQEWLRYGIRTADAVRLAQESLDEAILGPEEYNDLNAPPSQRYRNHQFGFDLAVIEDMSMVADGSSLLGDFDRARKMIARMKQWLDENQFKKDDAGSGYSRFQAAYLQSAAKLAEAEGHKIDALSLYTKAMATGFVEQETRAHARELWDAQGGTAEGWRLATMRLPAPKPADRPPVNVAQEFAAWTDVGKALPEADLRDQLGRTWNLSALKGKITFINVWATWCGPCREELPEIQRLYELSKQRGDFQVVTLSIDDNPGEIQPFLTANGYTVPVVLARSYVEGVTGPITIPQNWLVDGKATLREKSIGFDSRMADWANTMAERAARLGN
jgi:thiol-disulfide isomerase/thioredoxin